MESQQGKYKDNDYVRQVAEEKYKYGFTTDVHTEVIDRGLNEDVVRLISEKNTCSIDTAALWSTK